MIEVSDTSDFLDKVASAEPPVNVLPSPRPSNKGGLLVQSGSMDGFYLDIPSEDEIVYVGSRRCSARVISQSVQQTLRQLRKEQHDNRVSQLLERNALNYRRQRFCECVTMITFLLTFTCFTLYVVFAYGFHFGKGNPFQLVLDSPRKIVKHEDDTVDLLCQADSYWEWCRWIHTDRYCDFEWMSSSSGIEAISCDFPDQKVELIGNYDEFECGIRVRHLDVKDRGIWQCEIEKYYFGFSRRYGEMETSMINLVIKENKDSTESTLSDPTTTDGPLASAMTPNSHSIHNTTLNPVTEMQEYQRQFFFLKLFVLGGVGFVLASLTSAFWAYFMYLWKTWDNGKRDTNSGPGPYVTSEEERELRELREHQKRNLSKDDLNSSDDASLPEVNQALLLSRRKSVSFAVCTLDEDTMSFNIERKSVFLGDSARPNAPLFVPSSPLLVHMAKKLRAVTGGKSSKKRPTRLFDKANISFHPDNTSSSQQEVIEIYDEHGQLVGGTKPASDVTETEM